MIIPHPKNKLDEHLSGAINFFIEESEKIIMFSVRLALYLAEHGYSREVIIASIFLGNPIRRDRIIKKYGKKVDEIIDVNLPDLDIEDRTKQAKDVFERCHKHGKEALVLQSAYLYQQSKYLTKEKDREEWKWLMGKLKYFIDMSYMEIREEEVYKDLVKQYNNIKFIR